MARRSAGMRSAALGLALLPSAAAAQPLTLERLQEIALARNPTLAQVQARVDGAEADTAQAGLWPNPANSYRTETVNGHESNGIVLSQTLPTSGRIGASKAVHERDADVGRALLEEQRFRVRNSVRLLYRDALIAAEDIALQAEVIAHVEEELQTIRQLVNVGLADRTDVLETQMELRHARLDLNEYRIEERHLWVELAHMVGDPTLARRPLAGDALALPPPLDYDMSLARLLAESPELRAAEAVMERARAAVRFERAETRPDVVFELINRHNRGLQGFGHESPVPSAWEFSFNVGMTLPIWNRNQHGVRAAEADVREARADADRKELALRSKFEEVFHEYEVERAEAQVFRDEILPLAEEVYALALGRYEDFGEDYMEVLEARWAILDTRKEILESLREAWNQAVRIEGLLLDGGLAPVELHLLENAAVGTAATGYR